MNYEIKKGIPIPTVPQSSGQSIYPWHFMEHGDCFDVPIGKHNVSILRKAVSSNATRHKRRTGTAFQVITRTIIEGDFLRVWILKPGAPEPSSQDNSTAINPTRGRPRKVETLLPGPNELAIRQRKVLPGPTPTHIMIAPTAPVVPDMDSLENATPDPVVVKRWGPILTAKIVDQIKNNPSEPPGVMLTRIHRLNADYILDVRAQELMDNWSALRDAAGITTGGTA